MKLNRLLLRQVNSSKINQKTDCRNFISYHTVWFGIRGESFPISAPGYTLPGVSILHTGLLLSVFVPSAPAGTHVVIQFRLVFERTSTKLTSKQLSQPMLSSQMFFQRTSLAVNSLTDVAHKAVGAITLHFMRLTNSWICVDATTLSTCSQHWATCGKRRLLPVGRKLQRICHVFCYKHRWVWGTSFNAVSMAA